MCFIGNFFNLCTYKKIFLIKKNSEEILFLPSQTKIDYYAQPI